MAKKKNNDFMSSFSDEQKKMMERKAEKVGVSLDQMQALLSTAGKMGPVLFSAVVKLVELIKDYQDEKQAYSHHDDCPEELARSLCEAEQSALETLACAMHARHVACCDHLDHDDY